MSSRLKYVDPNRPRGRFSRAYAAFSNTRLGRFLSIHVVWKLDPPLMRATGGRLGFDLMIPTALLETRGARSGKRRRNAVIYFHDGERVTIVASKLGLPEHPGLVPQPRRQSRRHPRRHPDAGDGGRRRSRAPEALDACRPGLRAPMRPTVEKRRRRIGRSPLSSSPPWRRFLGEMQSWDLKSVEAEPHAPQILASAEDARTIVLDLPAGRGVPGARGSRAGANRRRRRRGRRCDAQR